MKNRKLILSNLNGHFVLMLFVFTTLTSVLCYAGEGEKKAKIRLSFRQTETERICKATVTSDNMPVKGSEVHFYVKRMYSLLPINKTETTDSAGQAKMLFPLDLPGDKDGNYTVVAKLEDDDNFGTVVAEAPVKWGVQPAEQEEWGQRSLSASRDKAPMILIIVSNLIIAVIWGTIFYVMYQVIRIRKASNLLKVKKK